MTKVCQKTMNATDIFLSILRPFSRRRKPRPFTGLGDLPESRLVTDAVWVGAFFFATRHEKGEIPLYPNI